MLRPIPAGTRPFLFALALAPLLTGCGSEAGYPSLARRSAELIGADGKLAAACPNGNCPGKKQPAPCPPGADSAPPARVTGSAPPVVPAPVEAIPTVPRSADLETRLAGLVAEARTAHARFEEKRPAATALIRTGGAPGSDGWARAELALAELQAAHAVTTSPLADLDRLTVDDRVAHAESDGTAPTERAEAMAIRAATATIAALDAEEAATLAALEPAR